MKAMDVMVHDVVTVKPDDEVAEAVRLLAEHDVSALPVVDDDKNVVGVISEADLLHREEIGTEKQRPWWLEAVTPASTLAGEFAKSHGRRVEEVMSTDVIAASKIRRLKRSPRCSSGIASSACQSCAAASSLASSAVPT
jgi:CBS-domain-containing membrane protein